MSDIALILLGLCFLAVIGAIVWIHLLERALLQAIENGAQPRASRHQRRQWRRERLRFNPALRAK